MLKDLVITDTQHSEAVASARREWQAAVALRDRLSWNQPCPGNEFLERQYAESQADVVAKAHAVSIAQANAINAAPGEYTEEQQKWASVDVPKAAAILSAPDQFAEELVRQAQSV
jgi:hypothetical protein